MIYDQAYVVHDDLDLLGPDLATFALNACRALDRETGCSWAPWRQMGSGSYRCAHGLMVTTGVPTAILEGDKMPGVADWLRREHTDQIALAQGRPRPEGHDQPYQPQARRADD